MEKISRILPGSPRVTTADLRGSGVARPGSPGFGRPMGVSALAAKPEPADVSMTASKELSNLRFMREPNQPASRDEKADIVQRMSDSFFMKKARQPEVEVQNDVTSEILEKFHSMEDSDLNPMTGAPPAELADEEMPIKGGNLNIVA